MTHNISLQRTIEVPLNSGVMCFGAGGCDK